MPVLGGFTILLTLAAAFAASGEQGLKLAAQNRPDLIILDLLIPRMDGYEVLARLRGLLRRANLTRVRTEGSLAVGDLIAGQVQVVFADPVSALSQVRGGALIALAVTSKERSPVAPEVPTIAESGYPGFDAVAWHGIMAPAGTPKPIIDRLNAAIVDALKEPQTAKLIEAQAMQIVGNSPEQFAAFIKQDVELWKEVARQAKVEVK